jgi:hypothetical protein
MMCPWPNFAIRKIRKTKFSPVEIQCELYSKLTQVRPAEVSVSDIAQVRFAARCQHRSLQTISAFNLQSATTT